MSELSIIQTRAVVNYLQGSQYNQQTFSMAKGLLLSNIKVSGWLGLDYSKITESYGRSISGFRTNGSASEYHHVHKYFN